MNQSAIKTDEPGRQAALRRYRILDTDPERAFDDLALLASHICGTPIALISLLDADRQWFKSRVGISLAECERIHRLARERWDGLHHEMTREMRRAYEAADQEDSGRIRVGIYTYYEDAKAEAIAAQPAARKSRESKE